MAKELILLDTSVLIDYFRKKDKSKSYFSKLAANSNYEFAISVITEFEILFGSTDEQKNFWNEVMSNLSILNLDSEGIQKAVQVQKDLKRKSQMSDIPDLLMLPQHYITNLKLPPIIKGIFKGLKSLRWCMSNNLQKLGT